MQTLERKDLTMSGNICKKPGMPHKGWRVVDCVDYEDNYQTCEFCDQYPVRYVHVMEHDAYSGPLKVGRCCAQRMSEGYDGHAREAALKHKPWYKRRSWNFSSPETYYKIGPDGTSIGIMESKFHPGKYIWRIRGKFSDQKYNSLSEAEAALYRELESQERNRAAP